MGFSGAPNEIIFDGRDDNGQLLYNGTYVCVIKKTYPGKEDKEKCESLL